MERDQLKAWLDAGMSPAEIGALAQRDASTIGYRIKKHGLAPNGRQRHASRGGLTRDLLEPLIEREMTVAEIAEALRRSPSTVR